TDGRLWGRPTNGIESKHLLTGLGRCGLCQGGLLVRSRAHGTGRARRRAFFYACASFHHRGSSVCPNSLEMRVEAADGASQTKLEEQILDEDIITEAMRRAIARAKCEPEDLSDRRRALEERGTQIATELERLTAAVLEGGQAATLVQAMRTREQGLKDIRESLARLAQPQRVERADVEAMQLLQAKLTEWRGLLRAHVPQARQIVRKLLVDRITFTPDR